MKVEITSAQALRYVKRNWFTLSILLLALLFYIKKDFSFQLNVATPEKSLDNNKLQAPEKMTDASPAFTGKLGNDKLEIPFIGGRQNERNGLQELAAINESTRTSFLERFAKVARAEQEKFDIPASIILAVSMYQSCSGRRDLALQSNNFFAIPCTSEWRKGCNSYQGKQYREYETAWASFRDFSLFSQEFFKSLRGGDYKNWASGMQKSGFGEDSQFARNVIQIIETYELQKLDR